jgi:hypothetical protein
MDVWLTAGLDGTARTICYLTDNPEVPTNVIALRCDSQNRPLLSLTKANIVPVAATQTLTLTANATNTETVTIGGKVYTFEASLTNANGNVQIGATAGESLDNLVAAINLDFGAGTKYAAATTLHPTVRASRGAGDTMVVTAKVLGSAGNAIGTTETLLNGSWGAVTLLGGADGDLTTEAGVTPSGPNYVAGRQIHVRLAWDSTSRISGARYASFVINGRVLPVGDWTSDPLAAWTSWQPTHLVLGVGLQALYGEASYNGVIQAVQLSNLALP